MIFGVGQVADVAWHYLTHDSHHDVVAFCVDRTYIRETEHLGLPVVAFEDIVASHPPGRFSMFVPISYRQVNLLRKAKYEEAKRLGYHLVSYVSSRAAVSAGVHVGENCFILEDNVIQPFVTIGDNVVLWSGNHIGHHSVIEDHCFLASHVVVSGSVTIEERCFLGVNATLRDNIRIARETVIGAGALVLRDTTPGSVLVGPEASKLSKKSDELRGV